MVVAALVGFPDALDAQPVVLEGVEAASSGGVCRLGGWGAGGDEARGHDLVADGSVVGAGVGGHADVGGVAGGVVGDRAVDGVVVVVGAGRDDQRLAVDPGDAGDERQRLGS